jgi:uncharacterized protein (DUF2225 family)
LLGLVAYSLLLIAWRLFAPGNEGPNRKFRVEHDETGRFLCPVCRTKFINEGIFHLHTQTYRAKHAM